MTPGEMIAMRKAGFLYREIAVKAGLPMGTVRSRLRKWGVEPEERPLIARNRSLTSTKDLDPGEVRRLYWDEEWSVCQIGKNFGIPSSTITQFMMRHGIPRRSRSAAQRTAHARETTPRRWASMTSARARELAEMSNASRRRAA